MFCAQESSQPKCPVRTYLGGGNPGHAAMAHFTGAFRPENAAAMLMAVLQC